LQQNKTKTKTKKKIYPRTAAWKQTLKRFHSQPADTNKKVLIVKEKGEIPG
jgi:hypothetical protein